MACAAVLPFASGWRRCAAATVLLVGWATVMATTRQHPPMIAFVGQAFLYIALAPTWRDRADRTTTTSPPPPMSLLEHAVFAALRCSLAVGYAITGGAKFWFTPAWRHGIVFEAMAGTGNPWRGWVRSRTCAQRGMW